MKKLLLFGLVLILLSSFASAIIDWNTDAVVFYNATKLNSTDLKDWSTLSNHGKLAGTESIIDDYINFNGNFHYLTKNNANLGTGTKTLCLWINDTHGAIDKHMLATGNWAATNAFSLYQRSAPIGSGGITQVGDSMQTTGLINTGLILLYCGMYNGSNTYKTFINSSVVDNTDTMTTSFVDGKIALGTTADGNTAPRATSVKVYTAFIINRSITSQEIDQILSDGYAYNPFSTITSPPSFVAPTPADGSTNNTQVNISLTCAGNITLWFNETNPPPIKVIDNLPSPQSYLTNATEGIYYYTASCFNATSGLSVNTSIRNWTYDTTEPSITLNANNMFDDNNYSLVNQYLNESRLNMTFNDNFDLFGYRINITRNGAVYYNETNTTITGTEFNYTKLFDITSWEAGIYNISVLVADSHTEGKIKDYKVTKGFKKLYFDTAEGNKIKLDFNDDVYTDAKKLKDRYTFMLNFSDGLTKNRTFTIKADTPIVYRQDSQYQGHFIVWNKNKGNWIDFVGSSSPPTITQTGEKKYDIFFENLPPYIEFNSIGGLNIKEINYTWYRGNYTLEKPISFVGERTFIQLNITTDASIKDINATLFYNGVQYNGTNKTNHTTYFSFENNFTAPLTPNTYNFYWEVTTLQGSYNLTMFNISSNQTILNFAINNCSVTNITTAIFNIRDEDIPTNPLNATLEVDAVFWITTPDNSRNFTQEFGLNDTHILCLNNASIAVYADMYIKYVVPNSFTHRYYIFNTTFNATPKNYTLYNFVNTTGKSTLAINIRNRDTYENFVDVFTYLERRYIGDGVWRVVQMGLSDDFGNSYYNIIEKDADYRVILKDYGNHILYKSANYNFNCIASLCSIIFKILPFDGTTSAAQLKFYPSYNNDTQILSVYFEDLTFLTSSARLLVTKETAKESIELCKQTINSHSGTFSCNLTGYTGDVLVQGFGTASPEDDKFSQWINLGQKLLAKTLGQDESAFLSLGIYLVVTLSGILFGAAIGAIMAILAVGVIIFFQIFNALTITLLIIFAAMGIVIGIIVRR